MKSNQPHLIVVSIDAIHPDDCDYFKQLPNFRSFIEEGAIVRELTSIYPSITYACHSSMITGTTPEHHGIYANELPNPQKPTAQDWYWYRSAIRVPTLFDYARNNGQKTANVLWPVMAGAKLTYNFPEIWSEKGESFFSLFLKNATLNTFPMLLHNLKRFKGKQQPYLDDFVTGIAMDMIQKKPQLLCIHLIELDHQKHVYGAKSEEIKAAMNRIDAHLGNIINATKKAGIYEQTNFILMGDHGSKDYHQVISLNRFFLDRGHLRLNKEDQIIEWKAYANSCGGSAQVHIHPDTDIKTIHLIESELKELCSPEYNCLKRHYTKEEARLLFNLSGDFTFVVEPVDDAVFTNAVLPSIITPSTKIPGTHLADHGYNPNMAEMKTMLVAKGPGIQKGATLDHAHIIDAAPTFATLLNLQMKDVEGRVLHEILSNPSIR